MSFRKSAMAAVLVATTTAAIGLTGVVSQSANEHPTCSNDEGAGVSFAGGGSDRGRFGSPQSAAQATAARELRDYDDVRQKSDGRYAAQRNGRDVAYFQVIKMPRGGYEVGGMIVCAANLRPDTSQP